MLLDIKYIKTKVQFRNQILIFNTDLYLIHSCNSIFKPNPTEKLSLQIPIIESVFTNIKKGKIQLPFIINAVTDPSPFLTGHFDFEIYDYHKESLNNILMIIKDKSNFYGKLQKKQQVSHENEIRRQITQLSFGKNNLKP